MGAAGVDGCVRDHGFDEADLVLRKSIVAVCARPSSSA